MKQQYKDKNKNKNKIHAQMIPLGGDSRITQEGNSKKKHGEWKSHQRTYVLLCEFEHGITRHIEKMKKWKLVFCL